MGRAPCQAAGCSGRTAAAAADSAERGGAAGSRGAERGPGRPVSSPTALQLRPRLSKC